MVRSKVSRFFIYFALIFGVLLILIPLYLTVITPFKTPAENAVSFFQFPSKLYLDNFTKILSSPVYYKSLINTVYVTILSLAGCILLMPMISYAIARSMSRSRWYRIMYFYILLGIFIPFQVKMVPLVRLMSSMHLMQPTGLSILYISCSTCETVFLFVQFFRSIPYELEEAAYIDGATTSQTYHRVILPLLKPMIATVLIKNGLWIWNDFMLPLLVLNRTSDNWTLTLFQYNFKSEYTVDYGPAFATFVMSMLPIMIFYCFMQKHIIGGLTAGSVKM